MLPTRLRKQDSLRCLTAAACNMNWVVVAFQHVSGLYNGRFGILGDDRDPAAPPPWLPGIHQKRNGTCWKLNRFGLFTIGDAVPDLCHAPLITRQELPGCTCDRGLLGARGDCR